jgi:hypothetical protein
MIAIKFKPTIKVWASDAHHSRWRLAETPACSLSTCVSSAVGGSLPTSAMGDHPAAHAWGFPKPTDGAVLDEAH